MSDKIKIGDRVIYREKPNRNIIPDSYQSSGEYGYVTIIQNDILDVINVNYVNNDIELVIMKGDTEVKYNDVIEVYDKYEEDLFLDVNVKFQKPEVTLEMINMKLDYIIANMILNG